MSMSAQTATIEEIFREMEETIGKLEDPQITLEDAFQLYQGGVQLIRECNEKIGCIEKQMIILEENGEKYE